MQNPLFEKLGNSFHDSRLQKKISLSTMEMQTMRTNDSHVFRTRQGRSTRVELADMITRYHLQQSHLHWTYFLCLSFGDNQNGLKKRGKQPSH